MRRSFQELLEHRLFPGSCRFVAGTATRRGPAWSARLRHASGLRIGRFHQRNRASAGHSALHMGREWAFNRTGTPWPGRCWLQLACRLRLRVGTCPCPSARSQRLYKTGVSHCLLQTGSGSNLTSSPRGTVCLAHCNASIIKHSRCRLYPFWTLRPIPPAHT